MSFDGNGHWTIGGAQQFTSSTTQPQSFSATGTYTISSAGFGYLTSPADSSQQVYVLVSNGIVFGSATENNSSYVDMFVAAPLASPQPTLASLSGTYQLAFFSPDYTNGPDNDADAFIQLTANGSGSANAIFSGYLGGPTQAQAQTSSNLTYVYTNSAANITFPTSSTARFISNKNEYLYMSPDGSFVFGGSPQNFDMIVGVKTNGANPPGFSGLFYQAGIDDDNTQGQGDLYSWYGSFSANQGNIWGHQRIAYGSGANGFTYPDVYSSFQNGGYTNSTTGVQYMFNQSGTIRLGIGLSPFLGVNLAMQAPTLTGSGVYLNPQGISNSASSAPFTAGVSDGEFITLYGSNLAQGTVVANALPFPQNLGGVQVLINGINAPIYYVSATQISVIVPFENTASVAQIQVISGGTKSNVITAPVNQTTPAVFTIDSRFGGLGPGGLGYAAAEHADYSVVSSSNPAKPGETIQIYVTGLGATNPTIQDGAAGPTNPFSYTTNTFTIDVGGTSTATPAFVGLAPALAGLYQINVQIPTGLAPGTYLLGITGPDSYTDEAEIQVGTAAGTTSAISPSVANRATLSETRLQGPRAALIRLRSQQKTPHAARQLSGVRGR